MENWLSKVAEKHTYWIKLVQKFGAGNYSEDIVQEMYLKINKYADEKKTIVNGKVNSRYIYLVLYSIFIEYMRQKSKIKKIQIEEFYKDNDFTEILDEDIKKLTAKDDIKKEEAYAKLCNKMDEELKNWHFYDVGIFEIYRDTHLSIRGMAKDTKISFVNIFHTLKKGKQIMKEKFGEDYEDFKNEDYDLI
jgi:hypothetical protein